MLVKKKLDTNHLTWQPQTTDFAPANFSPLVEANALIFHSTVDAKNMCAEFAAVLNSCFLLVTYFEIHLFVLPLPGQLWMNMTSSTKPEVPNLSKVCQSRINPQLKAT